MSNLSSKKPRDCNMYANLSKENNDLVALFLIRKFSIPLLSSE